MNHETKDRIVRFIKITQDRIMELENKKLPLPRREQYELDMCRGDLRRALTGLAESKTETGEIK